MERLLTAQQVADGLRMHIKTLYRLLRTNKIALNYVPMGRSILFRPAEVERFISSLEVIRDGSGRKRRKQPVMPSVAPPIEEYPGDMLARPIMTDEEAQEFFKGIDLIDGVLISAENAEEMEKPTKDRQ